MADERDETIRRCRECDEVLPRASPGGLCPRCLMGGLAGGWEESGDETAEVNVDGVDGLEGARFGRYKILQRIGEGGFGVVYMAEQVESVQRRVALKIIKAGMDSRQVIARFEAERQALAMMEHPNIARVLDVGETEEGRPYFVMELVKGMPITSYCVGEKLPVSERLELFVKVCGAVQHAHLKGIIHRDLKPSNILITLHDGQAVPKVIDFGIAKAMDQRLTDKTLFTRYDHMVGTPAYMSPEQAALSGLDVDTRSDVYALGVLLYELLTETTPFDSETLRVAAFDEMRRMIREDEPARPSVRLTATREAAVGGRGGGGRAAGAEIARELDWIAMKALEKDRARRYETAAGLAEDIGRFRRDEPVVAGPPGVGYRVGKFLRRNRPAVAAAAALVVSLVAGLAVATVGFSRAKEEAANAEAARAETAREKEALEAVYDFLQEDLLGSAGENPRPEPELTMMTALDRAALRVEERFADEPRQRMAVHQILGFAYFSVGTWDKGYAQRLKSFELAKAHLAPSDEDYLNAQADYADALIRNNDGELGFGLLKRTYRTQREVLGRNHPSTLSTLLSYVRWRQLEPTDEAIQLGRELVDAWAGEVDSTDACSPHLAVAVLGKLLSCTEKPNYRDEAERLLKASIAASEGLHGEVSSCPLFRKRDLAEHYQRHGIKLEEASRLFDEVERGFNRIYGTEEFYSASARDDYSQTIADLRRAGLGSGVLEVMRERVEGLVREHGIGGEESEEVEEVDEALRGLLELHYEEGGVAALAPVVLALAELDPDAGDEEEVLELTRVVRAEAVFECAVNRAAGSRWEDALVAAEDAFSILPMEAWSAERLRVYTSLLAGAGRRDDVVRTGDLVLQIHRNASSSSDLYEVLRAYVMADRRSEARDVETSELLRGLVSTVTKHGSDNEFTAQVVAMVRYALDGAGNGALEMFSYAIDWEVERVERLESPMDKRDIVGFVGPAAHAMLAVVNAELGDGLLAAEHLAKAETPVQPALQGTPDIGRWWDLAVEYRLALERARQAVAAMDAKEEIVSRGARWAYLAPSDGVDPAVEDEDFHETFALPGFDDSGWKTGVDEGRGFGYGEPVNVEWPEPALGLRKTAYLRLRFTVEQPVTDVVVRLQYDDGVIGYLDGEEVFRKNIEPGVPDRFDLMALKIQNHAEEAAWCFELGGDVLEPGEHVLAISVHNQRPQSSDLRVADIRVLGRVVEAGQKDLE